MPHPMRALVGVVGAVVLAGCGGPVAEERVAVSGRWRSERVVRATTPWVATHAAWDGRALWTLTRLADAPSELRLARYPTPGFERTDVTTTGPGVLGAVGADVYFAGADGALATARDGALAPVGAVDGEPRWVGAFAGGPAVVVRRGASVGSAEPGALVRPSGEVLATLPDVGRVWYTAADGALWIASDHAESGGGVYRIDPDGSSTSVGVRNVLGFVPCAAGLGGAHAKPVTRPAGPTPSRLLAAWREVEEGSAGAAPSPPSLPRGAVCAVGGTASGQGVTRDAWSFAEPVPTVLTGDGLAIEDSPRASRPLVVGAPAAGGFVLGGYGTLGYSTDLVNVSPLFERSVGARPDALGTDAPELALFGMGGERWLLVTRMDGAYVIARAPR